VLPHPRSDDCSTALITHSADAVRVNQTVFVGQGRIYPGSSVQYRVYRVN
jgi:hypothetical protein